MSGLMLIFVVVFVLVLAAVCALIVLRMLASPGLSDSPRFPRHRTRYHHAAAHAAQKAQTKPEGLPEKH
jgi:flagellar basal body-associated protein FliL